METFFAGQRVRWQYTHHLNSRSSIEIAKHGTCIRQMRERKGLQQPLHPEIVLVHFDGNKTLSKVKLAELEPLIESKP